MNPSGAARKQRHAHPMDIQHIVVASLHRAKARVECVRHRMRPLHGDTVRQESIEAAHPRKLGTRDVRIKMNTLLSACTPASVRPAVMVETDVRANAASARSSASCTVFRCGCDCQPENRAPLY